MFADCDATGRPVFTGIEIDRLVARHGDDRVQLGHFTGMTWEMAFEQFHQANNGIVLQRGAPRAPLRCKRSQSTSSPLGHRGGCRRKHAVSPGRAGLDR